MSEELKPCPFCGSSASISNRMNEDIWSHNQVNYVTVSCSNEDLECGVEPSVSWPEDHQDDDGTPMAIKGWNTRTPPPGDLP